MRHNDTTNTENTSKSPQKNTTTNHVVDELFTSLDLKEEDIKTILELADGNTDKLISVLTLTKNYSKQIANLPGFIISALENNYTTKPFNPRKKSDFKNFLERDLNYSELEELIDNDNQDE